MGENSVEFYKTINPMGWNIGRFSTNMNKVSWAETEFRTKAGRTATAGAIFDKNGRVILCFVNNTDTANRSLDIHENNASRAASDDFSYIGTQYTPAELGKFLSVIGEVGLSHSICEHLSRSSFDLTTMQDIARRGPDDRAPLEEYYGATRTVRILTGTTDVKPSDKMAKFLNSLVEGAAFSPTAGNVTLATPPKEGNSSGKKKVTVVPRHGKARVG